MYGMDDGLCAANDDWILNEIDTRNCDEMEMLRTELSSLQEMHRDLEHRHRMLLKTTLQAPERVWASMILQDGTKLTGMLSVRFDAASNSTHLQLKTCELRVEGRVVDFYLQNNVHAWAMQNLRSCSEFSEFHSKISFHLHDGTVFGLIFGTEWDRAKFDHMFRGAI